MIFILYPILPPTHPPAALKEHMKRCMSLHLRLKQDFVKALDISFSLFTAPGTSLEPQNVVSATRLALFSLNNPVFPYLFSVLSHSRIPCIALPSASCCESETVTNSNK